MGGILTMLLLAYSFARLSMIPVVVVVGSIEVHRYRRRRLSRTGD